MNPSQPNFDHLNNIQLLTQCWYSFKGTYDMLTEVRSRVARNKFKTEIERNKIKGFFKSITESSKDLHLQYDLMSLLVNKFDAEDEAKIMLEAMKTQLNDYKELFDVLEDSLNN